MPSAVEPAGAESEACADGAVAVAMVAVKSAMTREKTIFFMLDGLRMSRFPGRCSSRNGHLSITIGHLDRQSGSHHRPWARFSTELAGHHKCEQAQGRQE